MKATTKAQKLRAKRGRPRKVIVYREPNGRASRSREPADKLATETRARMLGITVHQAKNPLSVSYIGRLHMQHQAWEARAPQHVRPPLDSLTHEQYSAAVKYRDLHNDNLKRIQAESAYHDGHVGSGGDIEALEKWGHSVKERYDAARKAIMEAQFESREANLFAAIDYCIVRDEAHPHMIAWLRLACNALVRHWR